MHENYTDRLSNNLRLNEICIQFYCKINRNRLEAGVEATYGLHANKHFEILNLKFGERSLVKKHSGVHSNFRGADEIRDLPISIEFLT